MNLQPNDSRSEEPTHDWSASASDVEDGLSEEAAVADKTIDRSPTRVSMSIAIGCAGLGALTLPSPVLVGIGLLGAFLVGAGAVYGARRSIGYGTLILLSGVLIAGSQGAPPEPLVVCTLLTVLAWDAGRYGITIGEQLGRETNTVQIELAHSALNATIGVIGTGLGYAVYRVVAGGQPVVALLLLLFGTVILVVTLR